MEGEAPAAADGPCTAALAVVAVVAERAPCDIWMLEVPADGVCVPLGATTPCDDAWYVVTVDAVAARAPAPGTTSIDNVPTATAAVKLATLWVLTRHLLDP